MISRTTDHVEKLREDKTKPRMSGTRFHELLQTLNLELSHQLLQIVTKLRQGDA